MACHNAQVWVNPALTVSDGDGVPRLRDIDPDENFATMLHRSRSCGEDRLGHSEQPSRHSVGRATSAQRDIRSYCPDGVGGLLRDAQPQVIGGGGLGQPARDVA
jgi:hypothetical protein